MADTPAWELIVVDNASSDGTGEVVRQAWPTVGAAPLRVLSCPVPGASRARNTGIAAARGRVLLFVDDDIRVDSRWVATMSRPILEQRCDALVGRVIIPPRLCPDWLTGDWPAYFASTEHYSEQVFGAVTACMGVSRRVFSRIPGFDPELGGGGLGYYEDILFGWQLNTAGFVFRFEPTVTVEHHLDARRFRLEELQRFARGHGTSRAYFDHHWQHVSADGALRHFLGWLLMAPVRQALSGEVPEQPAPPLSRPQRSRLMNLAYWQTLMQLAGKPRNYNPRGLNKLRGVLR